MKIIIIDCLTELNCSFDIIAISETWEDESNTIQNYNMHGYNVFSTARTYKRGGGGGVALYITNIYNGKRVTTKSVSVENILECVTVEIYLKQHKNILVMCVYRAPGETISSFCDNILPIIENNSSNKKQYMRGDFNVNLLQHDAQANVAQFLLFNVCDRLTSSHNKTLIDNICTNDIDIQYGSGIIIDDLSDHLPIFSMCVNSIKKPLVIK